MRGVLVHAMGERVQAQGSDWPAVEFLRMSPTVAGRKLSAHCLVTPEGTVLRCVDDTRIAYHAGVSKFGELENLNATFLGVEVLLPGTWEYGAFKKAMLEGKPGYTDAQYAATAELVAGWMKAYGISHGMVTGHENVAGDSVRGEGKGKVDPGTGWDWLRFRPLVNGHLSLAADGGKLQD